MLSIIVPVYNAESFLNHSLKSLVMQDYSDKEIILIDDGSEDGSPQICDEYAERYNYIRTLHKENGGVSSARNLGLEMAQGEYIAFADADDRIDYDFYSILMKILVETDSDVAACSLVNEYGRNFGVKEKQEKIPEIVVFDGCDKVIESVTSKENSIEGYTTNKIWKKSLIGNHRFRSDISMCEDSLFSWEVLKNANRACFCKLPMYHHFIHMTSTTRNSALEKYKEALQVYELMIKDAKKNAHGCLDGLCTDYIIWNLKTCEQMIFSCKPDMNTYHQTKENIKKYEKYIKKCGLRHRTLAKAALKSWDNYAFKAKLVWNLKKMYMRIR